MLPLSTQFYITALALHTYQWEALAPSTVNCLCMLPHATLRATCRPYRRARPHGLVGLCLWLGTANVRLGIGTSCAVLNAANSPGIPH